MPIIECSYCGEEFYSIYSCEEHERVCVANPESEAHEIAEQMRLDVLEGGVKAWQS